MTCRSVWHWSERRIMRLYSFRLTAAVSPFMAYNRHHRAAISVSLSAGEMGRRRIFFSQLIIYRCLFIVPQRVLFIWDWKGVARSQREEKSLAGVLRHIVRHLCLFTARHGCRVHRLISRKDTLMSKRYKSLKGENWGSFFFPLII